MDFDDAERSEATQTLELSEEDCKEDFLIPLRYVKFQNVQSVTVRRRPPVSSTFCFPVVCLLHPLLEV